MDTQWPRFQVFVQEKPGDPLQDAGSVHAPDPEMALLNARDVFVRRPECYNLWIVPAEAIYSRTRQQLQAQASTPSLEEGESGESGSMERYYVFCKPKPAGTQTLAGEVEALSPAQALQLAAERLPGNQPPYAWWIFPARLVVQTNPDDFPSMFAPAWDKPFRLATDFHTLTAMREIKNKKA